MVGAKKIPVIQMEETVAQPEITHPVRPLSPGEKQVISLWEGGLTAILEQIKPQRQADPEQSKVYTEWKQEVEKTFTEIREARKQNPAQFQDWDLELDKKMKAISGKNLTPEYKDWQDELQKQLILLRSSRK